MDDRDFKLFSDENGNVYGCAKKETGTKTPGFVLGGFGSGVIASRDTSEDAGCSFTLAKGDQLLP